MSLPSFVEFVANITEEVECAEILASLEFIIKKSCSRKKKVKLIFPVNNFRKFVNIERMITRESK
jgi:hypothetical protein